MSVRSIWDRVRAPKYVAMSLWIASGVMSNCKAAHSQNMQLKEFAVTAAIPGQFEGQDLEIFNWMTAMYVDVLRRQPDAEEVSTAIAAVKSAGNKAQAREKIAFNLLTSSEGAKREIMKYYRVYLKRRAEQEGLDHWISQVLTPQGKKDTKQVQLGFIGSEEYYQNAGGTDKGFIKAVFLDVFRRPFPDGPDLDAFENHFRNGLGGDRVRFAKDMMETPEGKMQNGRIVQQWFKIYLRRPADLAGGIGFVQALTDALNNNQRMEKVKASLLGSDEYFNNVKISEESPD